MEINATSQDFAFWIADAIRFEAEIADGICKYRSSGGLEVSLELTEVDDIVAKLASKSEHEDTAIYDDLSFEILVREEAPVRAFRGFPSDGPFVLEDNDNGIAYTFSRPSDEYLLFLLYKIAKIASPRLLYDRSYHQLIGEQRLSGMIEKGGSILDILRSTSARFVTLHLDSTRKRQLSEFSRYANSFFFQVSYNYDSALVPQRSVEELVRRGRIITGVRRSTPGDIEAPKRFYTPDVIYHYQLAVASYSPPLEYLSYYHVAEHFFEDVFNDDLIEQVRSIITQPDFSYTRGKKIYAR